MADRTGQHERRLTSKTARDSQPAYSPGGDRIAFISDRGGSPAVWVIGADGTGLRQVSGGIGVEGHPSWSPDGERIAFDRWVDGDADIFVLDLGTGLETNVTSSPGNDLVARWSADGERLTFGTVRDDGDWEIYLIEIDDSAARRLTNRRGFDGDAVWLGPN